MAGVPHIAKQEILFVLGGNDALGFLFAEAVTRTSKERLIRNLRRLLLLYSQELAKDAQAGRSTDAARILRRDSE